VPAALLGRALALRSILGIGVGAAAPAAFGAVLDRATPGQAWGWAFALMGVGGIVATVCAALLPSMNSTSSAPPDPS
jgi:MFS family permease